MSPTRPLRRANEAGDRFARLHAETGMALQIVLATGEFRLFRSVTPASAVVFAHRVDAGGSLVRT